MTKFLLTLFVSIAAGVHAASYGAWKDSPRENYILRRTIRELVISVGIGLAFYYLHIWKQENYFILYLSSFTINRLITEYWKLFLRVEPQENYRIPTQIHLFGKVIESRWGRIFFSMIAVVLVGGVLLIGKFLLGSLSIQLQGVIVGLLIGLCDASGGAYKDGFIEGFYLRKFVKSPSYGIIAGFIASFQTTNPFFLLMGTIALMRMPLELFYKVLSPGYVAGKFKSMTPVYPNWTEKRKYFLIPYYATWVLFFVLWVWPLF